MLHGPAFNLLKGTCKSITELEYHLEECSKAITERLDWHNPENKLYPFDLRKPLPLIQDHRGRQIIPQDYFINKDLEYLKGGDLSRRYSTFMKYDQHAYLALHTGVPNAKDSTKIEVRQDDQKLYTFKEGDFKRLRLQDIEDILLLLTDCHSKVDGRSSIRPKGVIYKDQMNRNRLMHADELHKFSDGMLNDVWFALNDIAKGIRIEYLPMRKWSNLEKKRARVKVQDIDKQLYQRRLMRNLEKCVGGREYGNDLRLLESTI
ncbi:hypothetical protein Tco_1242121 [Tanacetum coccineum]